MTKTAPPPLSRNGIWRTYTTADGLAGLQVEHIAQDRDGYLWFATLSGASRFDGDTFENFNRHNGLCGDQVFSIYLDSHQRLWFATIDGGICWHDGRQFHHFDEDNGVCNGHAIFIFEDRDARIWFAGNETLGYYDGAAFHNLVPELVRSGGEGALRGCWGMAQDGEGHVWIASVKLVRYDGKTFSLYGEEEGLPSRGDYGCYTVANDAQGGLWVGAGNRFGRFDGKVFEPGSVELAANSRKIQRDRQGRMWICTTSAGGYCCADGEVQHFTEKDGLAYNLVNAMFQDREGLFWFATWGGGVSCFDTGSRRFLDGRRGEEKYSISVLSEAPDGSIWMGRRIAPGGEGETRRQVVLRCDGDHFAEFGETSTFLENATRKRICACAISYH